MTARSAIRSPTYDPYSRVVIDLRDPGLWIPGSPLRGAPE